MKNMVNEVSRRTKGFNDFLLDQFRRDQIAKIPQYLDSHIRNSIRLFGGRVLYEGYRFLSPWESVYWRINNSVTKSKVQINKSTLRVTEFKFVMGDDEYKMYLQLPYLHYPERCIYISDTKYFPIYLLAENVIRSFRDHISIKAASAAMVFYRKDEFTIQSVGGKVFREFSIAARLHWGKKIRETPPIILYHLVEFGWEQTLKLYGIAPEDIQMVEEVKDEEDFIYFKVGPDKFLRVREEIMSDFKRVRVVVSLTRVFAHWKKFRIKHIHDTALFKIILGRMTDKYTSDQTQLHKYAENHLAFYRVLLDPTTQNWLSKAGYPCSSMAELLMHVFDNIDGWLMTEPNNLYTKKLNSLDKLVENLIDTFSRKQYAVISPPNRFGSDELKRFTNQMSALNPQWIRAMCRNNPSVVNGNWLLSIGLKMERRLQSGSGRSQQHAPKEMLISHPSWLVVESPLNYPSSTPILSGTINPYLQIDEDGDIVKPQWADELSDVYE